MDIDLTIQLDALVNIVTPNDLFIERLFTSVLRA